jgi:hypothetical protein
MGTIYRTTISIPAELKARMDAVRESVNWSAVAARAFESRLLEIELRSKHTMSREDVLRRLKAVDEEEAIQERDEGKTAGQSWAEESATPKQLRRLQEMANDPYGLDNAIRLMADRRNIGTAWRLYLVLNPSMREEASKNDVAAFWEEALGDDRERIADKDFACGFVEGALYVWKELQDEL